MLRGYERLGTMGAQRSPDVTLRRHDELEEAARSRRVNEDDYMGADGIRTSRNGPSPPFLWISRFIVSSSSLVYLYSTF